MQERMREIDPARPPTPERAGWQPDPWGDGERYWDGERWTRATRETDLATGGEPAPAAERSEPSPGDFGFVAGRGPRDFELEAEEEDERPLRSGLHRAMIWAFALAALLALLATAVSIWPLLLRGPDPAPTVPQQTAAGLLHLTGSFTGSAHG